VNLLGARGGAEEASGAAKAIRIGLDGKRVVFGVRIRFAFQGAQQFLP